MKQKKKGTYEAATFLEELKQMVHEIVLHVLTDQSTHSIAYTEAEPLPTKVKEPSKEAPKEKKARKPRVTKSKAPDLTCPRCKKGTILRGRTAYGCSEYKSGCTFRLDYATYGDQLTDAELAQKLTEFIGS